MSKSGRYYIVVENSGMVGECDVGRFGSYAGAIAHLEKTYKDAERDHFSSKCLYPDICVEVDGVRSYEL